MTRKLATWLCLLGALGLLVAFGLGVHARQRQQRRAALTVGAGLPSPGPSTPPAGPAPDTRGPALDSAATSGNAGSARVASACGDGYDEQASGLCTPVDPSTGRPYSAEQLKQFDAMRAGPFVGSKNFFVPRVLSVREAERRRAQLSAMNALAEKVRSRAASEAEIEELFRFRERVVAYRMQLVAVLHAEAGGLISTRDPALDPGRITNPTLLAKYKALQSEKLRDYEDYKRARREHGLVAEVLPKPDTDQPPWLP